MAEKQDVDAQNYYSDNNTWDEDDINELVSLLSKIGELEEQRLEIKSCVAHMPKYAFGPIQFEIGDNGLITWGLEINGNKILLVIFDGNNLRRELADAIINEFKNYFDIVEVLTTDNHQYTGIARFTRSRGYKVVGDSISHDLIMRNVRRSVKQCLNGLRQVHVRYYPVIVEGVRLVGDSFNDMVKAAERGVVDWKKHFAVLIILPILTMVILGILLGIL
jgi:putative membrane protein